MFSKRARGEDEIHACQVHGTSMTQSLIRDCGLVVARMLTGHTFFLCVIATMGWEDGFNYRSYGRTAYGTFSGIRPLLAWRSWRLEVIVKGADGVDHNGVGVWKEGHVCGCPVLMAKPLSTAVFGTQNTSSVMPLVSRRLIFRRCLGKC